MRVRDLLKHCTYENALTYNDIKDMSDEELSKLITICWHESVGRYFNEDTFRCDSDGIFNLKYDGSNLEWETEEGGAYMTRYKADEKIHQLGDGEWDYGLYKPL